MPLGESEALHYCGRALNALGEHTKANDKLGAAIAIYRRCGAGERWVERVEAERSRTSTSSPSPTQLVEPRSIAPGDAIFRLEADYWTIASESRSLGLKDIKGFTSPKAIKCGQPHRQRDQGTQDAQASTSAPCR